MTANDLELSFSLDATFRQNIFLHCVFQDTEFITVCNSENDLEGCSVISHSTIQYLVDPI